MQAYYRKERTVKYTKIQINATTCTTQTLKKLWLLSVLYTQKAIR